MANLGTIPLTGGTISLASFSGSVSGTSVALMPNDLDSVIVGTETFVFHTNRATAESSSYVWTGLNASQSVDNLRTSINHANRSFYQRVAVSPNELNWAKTDPKFGGDRHYDGGVSVPFNSNAIALSSGSISGSATVVIKDLTNFGF